MEAQEAQDIAVTADVRGAAPAGPPKQAAAPDVRRGADARGAADQHDDEASALATQMRQHMARASSGGGPTQQAPAAPVAGTLRANDAASPFAVPWSPTAAAAAPRQEGAASPRGQRKPRRQGGGGLAAALRRAAARCGCVAPRADEEAAASASVPPPSVPLPLMPRRTLSKQVSMYAGAKRSLPSVVSRTYSDAEWFDALSRFPSVLEPGEEPSAMAAALSLRSMPTMPWVPEGGPHVPDPPLELAERDFVFVPVPEDTGFGGYWLKDEARSTPAPLPVDIALGCSKFVARAHETVPGVLLGESPTSLSVVAKPRSVPLGPLSRYTESFSKDGATTTWKLRRDLTLSGSSAGQLYFTACGTMILRVFAKPLFGGKADFVTEDYLRLDDEGNEVVLRQCVKHYGSGRTGVQYIVGRWSGDQPPPGH